MLARILYINILFEFTDDVSYPYEPYTLNESVSDNTIQSVGGTIYKFIYNILYESSPSSYSICIWSGSSSQLVLYSIVVRSHETDVGSTYAYYNIL